MELDVYVHGDFNTMDAARVLTGLNHLVGLVRALGGPQLQFTRLAEGSVATGFAALGSVDAIDNTEIDRTFRRLVRDLNSVEDQPEVPARWTDKAIEECRNASKNLGALSDRGVDICVLDGEQVIEAVTMTGATGRNLVEATRAKRTSIGSVVGRLDSLNVHGSRHEARLWPDRGGKAVVVHFPDSLVDQVRDEVGRRVEARGRLVRDYRGQPITLQLKTIKRLRTRDESPRLATGAGIAPEATTVKEYWGTLGGTA